MTLFRMGMSEQDEIRRLAENRYHVALGNLVLYIGVPEHMKYFDMATLGNICKEEFKILDKQIYIYRHV